MAISISEVEGILHDAIFSNRKLPFSEVCMCGDDVIMGFPHS